MNTTLNKVESKNSFHLLNAVKILQDQFGVQEVQSKCIIDKLRQVVSRQTVYNTLKILVRNGYLTRHEQGKYTFYKISDKGIELIDELIESRNKSVAKPIVEYMANVVRKKYPKEFEDVSDRDLNSYLYKTIDEIKRSIVKNAVINFTKP